MDLYYGLGAPADPEKARLCAYTELGQKRAEDDYFLGGDILMMVYANGRGVARNLDLALRFACDGNTMPDSGPRVQHLEELKAKNSKDSDFDVCDDIPRPIMFHGIGADGACDGRDDQVRSAKQDAIIAKWSAADKQAFAKLRKAADAFIAARSEAETDRNGAGAVIIPAYETAGLNDAFIAALAQFESGKLPSFTSADYAKADAELNASYRDALKAARQSKGTVTVEGIRETERGWLAYLTAWVTFGRQKYPNVAADSWRTWLTQERTTQLRDLPIPE